MLFNDPSAHDGFLLNVDTKWKSHPDCNVPPEARRAWHGHAAVRDLYCLAICHRTDLRSLRDLRAAHLPLLAARPAVYWVHWEVAPLGLHALGRHALQPQAARQRQANRRPQLGTDNSGTLTPGAAPRSGGLAAHAFFSGVLQKATKTRRGEKEPPGCRSSHELKN